MAPIMRQLTADFSAFAGLADAETPSAVSVTFALNQTIGADGDLVLRGEYTFATDDAGVLDVWLVVPDDADTGAPYTCYLPSNEQFSFVLAQGDPIDLLELWVLASVPVASLAEALLATYTPLATYTAGVATLTASIAEALTPAEADTLYAAIGHTSVKASAGALGHIRVGTNLSIDGDGVLSASGGSILESPHYVGEAGEPVFNGGVWSNFNAATHENLQFWKDANGVVTIVGSIKAAPATQNGTIWTMPSGYRPAKITSGGMWSIVFNLGPIPYQIGTDGAVVFKGSNGFYPDGWKIFVQYRAA
jgi:hypothetical protein